MDRPPGPLKYYTGHWTVDGTTRLLRYDLKDLGLLELGAIQSQGFVQEVRILSGVAIETETDMKSGVCWKENAIDLYGHVRLILID